MKTKWSFKDVNDNLDKIIDNACSGTAQIITKNEKPNIVVLSAKEFDEISEKNLNTFINYLETNRFPPINEDEYIPFNEFLLKIPQTSVDVDELTKIN